MSGIWFQCGFIFDVDGVLVASPHYAAWKAALVDLLFHYQSLRGNRKASVSELFTEMMYRQYLAGKPRLDGAQTLLQCLKLPADDVYVRQLCELKLTHFLSMLDRGLCHTYLDAVRFALDCKRLEKRIGVVSASQNASRIMSSIYLGTLWGGPGLMPQPCTPEMTLREVFESHVLGHRDSWAKSDMFVAAANALGLRQEKCVVVEDSVVGIEAAKAMKMKCIGVARSDDYALLQTARPDWLVCSLDAIARPDPMRRPCGL